MLRKLIPSLTLAALLLGGCASVQTEQPETTKAETKVVKTEAKTEVETEVKEKKIEYKEAIIETNKGIIVFKFYPKDAPNTVNNFIKLTEKNFYNGLTWHRVEPGFVIQGGCPNGNGTGGPGYTIKAEFNSKPHIKGTVAMARANHPDSAGSQFYICLGTASFLDGKYTVFGQVVEGQDVVDTIRIGDIMKKISLK